MKIIVAIPMGLMNVFVLRVKLEKEQKKESVVDEVYLQRTNNSRIAFNLVPALQIEVDFGAQPMKVYDTDMLPTCVTWLFN
ncbi:hypothetical protein TSUD_11590 [Trifolium subterraneum]|nr:hypothetical protein TSUD_11590 [Trifolium subterraneum]